MNESALNGSKVNMAAVLREAQVLYMGQIMPIVELHGRMDFVNFSKLHSKLPPWKFIHLWLREIHPFRET